MPKDTELVSSREVDKVVLFLLSTLLLLGWWGVDR